MEKVRFFYFMVTSIVFWLVAFALACYLGIGLLLLGVEVVFNVNSWDPEPSFFETRRVLIVAGVVSWVLVLRDLALRPAWLHEEWTVSDLGKNKEWGKG